MFYSSFCAGGSSADGKITSRRRESHSLCSPLSMNRVAGKGEGLNQMTVQTQHSGASSGTFFSETSMLLKAAAYCRLCALQLTVVHLGAGCQRSGYGQLFYGRCSIDYAAHYVDSLKFPSRYIKSLSSVVQKNKTKKKQKKSLPKGHVKLS